MVLFYGIPSNVVVKLKHVKVAVSVEIMGYATERKVGYLGHVHEKIVLQQIIICCDFCIKDMTMEKQNRL